MAEKTTEQTQQPAVNFDDFTLEDIEDFEEISGIPFEEIASDDDDARMPAKALTALVFLTKRQSDPNTTLADAKKVKLSELNDVLGGAADPNAEEGE